MRFSRFLSLLAYRMLGNIRGKPAGEVIAPSRVGCWMQKANLPVASVRNEVQNREGTRHRKAGDAMSASSNLREISSKGSSIGDGFARASKPSDSETPMPTVFPGTDRVNPASVFAAPGYTSPAPVSTATAALSLWLSAACLVIFPLGLIFTLVLGALSFFHARRNEGVGARPALGGIVISLVGMLLWGACAGLLYVQG